MEVEFSLLQDISQLESFLKEELKLSKSSLKKYGLNRKLLNKSFKKREAIRLPLDLLNQGIVNPLYKGPAIKIIHQDEQLIVLEKPHQIHCHPLRYNESDNILSFLRQSGHGKHLTQTEAEKGLLNRLDFETSGVLVFVKDPVLHRELRDNFENLIKQKTYHAIVKGDFDKEGEHKHFLGQKGEKGKLVIAQEDGAGKEATIIVEKLKYHSGADKSLLQVSLIGGHRHQIRVQLQQLGYPIFGDLQYGGEPAERLFLHAYSYTITIDEREHLFKSEQNFDV
ncbi:MAG: hypothetical protein HN509_07550 [Halobacteriovoraceae bacterium]|nr:hypothetical protein [Halobacteriovoraceae bacterium]